jgi:hypothetical protein
MKTLNVKLDSKTITISKLPLGKYAELLKALKDMPEHLQGLNNLESKNILDVLPTMLTQSFPDLLKVLSITTPLTPEEIEGLGLDEVVKVVQAVIEVNNYQEVWTTVKKALAQYQQAPETKTIG